MKSSFYFKHDLDARGDDKMRSMMMKHGARGYGIYWLIVEDLYRSKGRITRDYAAMAWAYHEPQQEIKSVAEDFGLFYDTHGKIACHRADRDLESRREASEKASIAGRASASQRALNSRSTQVNQERTGEERKGEDKTTATPSAVDRLIDGIKTDIPKSFDAWRFPKGFNAKYAGAYLLNVPVDECEKLLNTPRLGAEIKAALEWRIDQKKLETSRGK